MLHKKIRSLKKLIRKNSKFYRERVYNLTFFSKFINVKYCVSLGNGTDARNCDKLVKFKKTKIVPNNACISTAEAINNNLKVVCDINLDDYSVIKNLKKNYKKTSAIILFIFTVLQIIFMK